MSLILNLDEIFERTSFNPKSHFSREFKKYSISGAVPGLGKGIVRSLSNAHNLGFKQGLRQASSQLPQQDTSNEPEQTPNDSGDSNEQD